MGFSISLSAVQKGKAHQSSLHSSLASPAEFTSIHSQSQATMSSQTISRRQKTRKRQPLEVLQGGSPKKMAIEHESGRLQVNSISEFNRPAPTAISPPPPPPSPRNSTPLQPSAQLPLRRSPLHPNSSRISSMATQRYTVRPESYIQTHPAFARVTSDYEISNDRDLASSQPVSLIQLYTKTNPSRNKPKRTRASNSDIPDEVAGFREADESRSALPSYSTSAEYGLTDESGRLSPQSRLVSQEYTWARESAAGNIQSQTWQPSQDDYHTQKNPLNYASHYNAPPARESSYISESPFLRRADCWDLPGNEAGSVGMTPTPQIALDTPQSKSYSQPRRKDHMSASSLQLYRESFDRPHDKSPYESIRLKHRHNRTDLPEITSGLMYGGSADQDYENNKLNTTIRSEPNYTTHVRERISNAALAMHSREIRETHRLQDASASDSRLSSGGSATQRTLKEEIYAILDNMNSESRAHTETFAAPSSKTGQPIFASGYGEEQTRLPLRQFDDLTVDNTTELRRQESRVHDSDGRARYQQANTEEVDLELDQCDVLPDIAALTRSATPPKRTIKPPPGLGEVKETMFTKAAKAREERLREANAWFHHDSRGEKHIRQHIATVAEQFIDRTERCEGRTFSEQERTASKQAAGLLGDAIANLQAYRGRPRDYFSNFGPVESRYCDSAFGGRRSYFDVLW
ncbi:uncharacterized protein BDV17DRAFT_141403 [Aspergillus undulatus]|uniref:uncharacterized protein n=1 Tax=Aspergillus undulatus TaxID=1810928 RepID=UPI003CCDD0A9